MASYGELYQTLLHSVCDIRFVRRRPKPFAAETRRMWCTNCAPLLESFNGKSILNYRVPKNLPKYNPSEKFTIITWDILMQDFRTISVDACDIIKKIPANEDFWKFFNENILTMSTQEKINFMNS